MCKERQYSLHQQKDREERERLKRVTLEISERQARQEREEHDLLLDEEPFDRVPLSLVIVRYI